MLTELGKKARLASRQLARLTTEQKNAALHHMADALIADQDAILAANAEDIADGKAGASGRSPLPAALIDRLMLNEARLAGVADGLRTVADLPDPVGEIFDAATLPNGLQVRKQRVPLGVLGVIYEARPNVTVDVAGLALKSGNAVILRGGSETLCSNRALVTSLQRALAQSGIPADAIQFIDSADRARVLELLRLRDYVDMIIPRGGAGLHEFCRENSQIPVITGGIGICHLFIDESADQEAALKIIHNAKTQRPSVCNALDTVLVHHKIAQEFLPRIVEHLTPAGVTFRAEPAAASLLKHETVSPAGPEDFDTEWLSLVLGLKVVDGLDEAMEHIAAHSTAHSDGILTRDEEHAQRFIAEVDSAAVYVNASTRFTDGSELGLGAEVAISTQRLHARGPMALRELTTYKWVIVGDWH
ncbi:MAG TPA: glutamate-5-semialdehyde dehydrogenase, partial [Anaerolineales bacterium]|nr:glutamate-5-semialdehyde dehydrogenase [Anaerolineales bacterium]